jgi:hypothetical protein
VADLGAPATEPSLPAAALGPLQTLLAAQAEGLSAELQALFAARLEEVFQPLRDLVAAVQGWTDQVSRIWDLMEALGGNLVLANSLVPGEHEDPGASGVPVGVEIDAGGVAGSSSEMEVGAQTLDVLPVLDDALPEMVIQSVEKEAKVADPVSLGNDIVLNKKTDSPLGGNGVPGGTVASILLEEYLSGFRNTEPLSLLDAPILVQLEGDSTCAGRRSGRLEKKNKDCSIPAAKRAEHRLSESFGDRPKEVASKKRITSATARAVRELLEVNG